MYAVSRSALARSNVGMKCSPRAVTLKPPRAHPRMTSLSNALIFNPRASYSIVRNVLPIMSSLQKMSLQQKSFQVGASRRMAAIGLWSQIRLCSSSASSKYASEQPRQHKKEESPEDEFDKLWETDPVATLPPELQPLEPLPTSVWISIIIALILVAIAIPWRSWIDHVFFPPDDDD